MREYVAYNFPSKHGFSQRDNEQQIAKQKGKAFEDKSFAPENTEWLWETFWQIGAGRGNNGFGLCPITWQDIRAFSDVVGTKLNPWEVETIMLMDKALLEAVGKLQK